MAAPWEAPEHGRAAVLAPLTPPAPPSSPPCLLILDGAPPAEGASEQEEALAADRLPGAAAAPAAVAGRPAPPPQTVGLLRRGSAASEEAPDPELGEARRRATAEPAPGSLLAELGIVAAAPGRHVCLSRCEGLDPLSLDDRPHRSMTAPVVFGPGTGSWGTSSLGSSAIFKRLDGAPPTLRRSGTLPRSWTPSALVSLRAPLPSRLLARTQRCSVCLENVANADCVVLEECGRDSHVSCRECIGMHLKIRIAEGRVSDLTCPCCGDDGCGAKVTDSELEQLVNAETVAKKRRFERMTKDPQLRACPNCNELCSPQLRDPEDLNSGIVAEMECGACSTAFCFYHSNAHSVGPEACAAHERQMLLEEKKAHASVGSRQCPRCGVATEKSSGCNHMTCKCKCEWCWACGKEIANVGWHYNPLRPMSCAQFNTKTEQMDHARLSTVALLTRIFCWPASLITVLFVVLYIVVFLAFQVVLLAVCCVCNCASCCCLFWFCARRCEDKEESILRVWLFISAGLTSLIMGIPFLTFCLVWVILALPLWLTLLPCGGDCSTLFEMVSVPPITVMTTLEMFSG